MKKFLMFLTALVMTVAVSAQECVTWQTGALKPTDGWFVGVSGSATWSTLYRNSYDCFWPNINPAATVKLGKWVNPNVGLQLAFEGGAGEGAKTLLDHTNLTLEGLVNFHNLFGGYKGEPRLFEVVGELGAGWFHTYGIVDNFASMKAGLEFNFNLGPRKAWQLNIVPAVTYLPSQTIEHSYVSLAVGTTYKFKNHNGTHNLTNVLVIDSNCFNELNANINSLREKNAALEEALKDCKDNPVILTDTIYVYIDRDPVNNVVGFAINSSEVQEAQMVSIWQVANAMKSNSELNIVIKAYADAQTGSASYNQELSEQRAEAVKEVLVSKFNIDSERIDTEGLGATEQPFEENNWNRIAIFVKQ